MRRMLSPRLLPLTIGVMSLALSVRIGHLVAPVLAGDVSPPATASKAQPLAVAGAVPAPDAHPPAAPLPQPMAVPDAKPAAADPAAAAASAATAPAAEAGHEPASAEAAPADPAAAPQQASASGLDLDNLSDSEIDLLQKLADRRSALDGREKEIAQREALVRASEERLKEKVAEMDRLKGEIEGLLKQRDEAESSQMAGLVKVYESMKPKDAARILNDLEMPVLLEVMERMKSAKSAPILAAMDADRARSITASLAERHALPETN